MVDKGPEALLSLGGPVDRRRNVFCRAETSDSGGKFMTDRLEFFREWNELRVEDEREGEKPRKTRVSAACGSTESLRLLVEAVLVLRELAVLSRRGPAPVKTCHSSSDIPVVSFMSSSESMLFTPSRPYTCFLKYSLRQLGSAAAA